MTAGESRVRPQAQEFEIYGTRVVVETSDSLLSRCTADLLSPFACGGTASVDDDSARIVLNAIGQLDDIPSDLRDVPSRSFELPKVGEHPYSIYRDGQRWVVDFGSAGMIELDLSVGRVAAWLVGLGQRPPDSAPAFVRFAIIELLRTRGLFAVHSAVLARGDRCVAIVGPSGHGKTTSAVSLMRAGYSCLSDDSPLLRETASGLQFLPFPSRLSVTDRTVMFFKELQSVESRLRVDTRKRSIDVSEVFSVPSAVPARPVALIYPQIVDWPQSYLEPMSAARAFEELLPQTLLLLDRNAAVSQFEISAKLVKSLRCYRLHFGEDVSHLPALIGPLLADEDPLDMAS